MASEDRKEWYPATTDTWADLLPSDDGEMAVIRPMLANTSLETSPLRLAYDADEHGWSAGAFHGKVNTFGAAVVIGETQGGAVVGGYNPSGAALHYCTAVPVLCQDAIIWATLRTVLQQVGIAC